MAKNRYVCVQPLERGFSAVNKDSLEKSSLQRDSSESQQAGTLRSGFPDSSHSKKSWKKEYQKKITLSSHAGNNSTAVNKIVEVFHPNPYK